MGRPPEPVPADKAEKIIDGLHAGRSLTAICAEIGITPRAVTWWKMKDEAFASEFAQAREAGGHYLLDEAQDLADRSDPKDAAKVKIQVELRAKRAACFCPRVFGTKVQLGGDRDGVPIKVSHVDAEKELASILAEAAGRAETTSSDDAS